MSKGTDNTSTYEFTDGRDAQHFAHLSRWDGATAKVRKIYYNPDNPDKGLVWTVTVKGGQGA